MATGEIAAELSGRRPAAVCAPIAAGLCAHCALPSGEQRYCCLGCELAQQLVIEAQAGEQRTSSQLMVAAFLSLSVMMLSLFLYAEDVYEIKPSDGLLWLRQGYRIAAGVLSTPVIVMLGRPLVRRAFGALRERRVSIELLIAVGAFAAYGLSWKAVWLGGGDVYFDTACAALLLTTVGRSLEARVRRRAAGLIAPLLGNIGLAKVRAGWNAASMTLRPPVEIEPEMVVEVAPDTASPVDLVALAPGEVDLQAIRGEPWPATVAAGDVVLAGAVPQGVALRGRALCRMQDSTLRQLESLARRSRAGREGVTKLADRLAAMLIPVVFAVAATSFGYWLLHAGVAVAVDHSLAVLLVACPCTYGVLVPLLQWRTLRQALSEKQICIRDVTTVDRLAAVDTVVFDKTGTLTEPMQQVALHCYGGVTETDVWRAIAALESDVRHPLGRALAAVAARALSSKGQAGGTAGEVRPLPTKRQLPGLGIVGESPTGDVLALGSWALMSQQGAGDNALAAARAVCHDGALEQDAAARDALGSDVFLAVNAKLVARLHIDEKLRSEAIDAVTALRARGLALSIASGDGKARVAKVGQALGIAGVGQMQPRDKQRALIQGKSTLFVGDGINDVPAMAAADVSIAFGTDASALACAVADVVALTPDLTALPWLLDQARGALRTARAALAISTGYNVVFVALAAVGWLRPLWAGVSMLLSSLITLAAVMHRSSPRSHAGDKDGAVVASQATQEVAA